MIRNKADYKAYVKADMGRYRFRSPRILDRIVYNEIYFIAKYLRTLRRLEYLTNISKTIFQKMEYVFVFLHYKQLCYKYKINISINTCGPGLYIPHMGHIIVIPRARLGANCIIQPGVVIGTKDTFDNVATIGDNVEITLGVKIIGKVCIGNNVIIAPNSVVVKDIPNNCVVSGVPAVIIKHKT